MLNRFAAWWALAFLLAFVALAAAVLFVPQAVALFDGPIADALLARSPGATSIALTLTFFGSAPGIVLGMLALLAYFPTPKIAARLVIAVGAADAVANILKTVFVRARPPEAVSYITDGSYSFPSGHATAAMALYGFAACLFYVRMRTTLGRAAAIVLPAAAVLLIGASRVMLGVHFPTDVLGGYLLGALFVALAFALPPRIHAFFPR